MDGTTWPDTTASARPSFETLTYYELGCREAFEREANGVADLLLTAVLPRILVTVSGEDEPYLRRVFTSAAQLGAGIGFVERRMTRSDERSMDNDIAGALWQARRDLPAMPAEWERVAAFLLQSGHYLARTHPGNLPLLLEELPGV